MTKTISLVQQKGGSGKTTIADQLAFDLYGMGYKVAVADLDDQQSSRFHETVPWPEEEADFIIIDTCGSFEAKFAGVSIDDIISESDLVIIPVLLENDSLKPLSRTVQRCESKGKNYLIVINQARPRKEVQRELLNNIQALYPGKIAQTMLIERATMSKARLFGAPVSKVRGGASMAENYAEFLDEVLKEVG